MASITKTQGISLITLQAVAADTVVKSSAQDVSSKLAAAVFVHLGRDDTGGNLVAPVEIRVEASAKSSGDDQWFPLVTLRSNKTVPVSEVLTGTIATNTSTLTMADTTGFAVGQVVFIKNSTLANSEFHRLKDVVTNANVKIIDNLSHAQTGATIYTQAEMFVAQVDLTSIGRIRLVVDASNTGRSIVVEGFMVTGDSIS